MYGGITHKHIVHQHKGKCNYLLSPLRVTPEASYRPVCTCSVQVSGQATCNCQTSPQEFKGQHSTPYKRTNPSTIQRLKEVATDRKPSAAFEHVDTEMGGMKAGSAGKLPRIKKQVSDVSKRLFGAERGDDLAVMMEICKCLSEGEVPFVRSVQAAP